MTVILVTGADGQVGRELMRRAGARDMIGLGRTSLDIADRYAVEDAFARYNPDCVINAAAYTAVDRAESQPALAYAANGEGPANLARACIAARVPLLHISTDYVFDGSKPSPWLEDDSAAPLNVYGRSKWQGEQAIREHHQLHLILRVSWVFGTYGSNFVKTMLRLGRERDRLRIVADQRGGPTPAAAIASTLLALCDRALADASPLWGTYHYCGAPGTTWSGFAEAIFDEAIGRSLLPSRPTIEPIAASEYPTAAQRPTNSMLDCSRLERAFGIPQPDWRAGLSEVLDEMVRSCATA